MYPQSIFCAKILKDIIFSNEIFNFYRAEKNLSFLHGHVFVMESEIKVIVNTHVYIILIFFNFIFWVLTRTIVLLKLSLYDINFILKLKNLT